MERHAGIDVLPERSSACVVDVTGRILGPQALGAGGRQTPGPEAGQGGPGAQARVGVLDNLAHASPGFGFVVPRDALRRQAS
jgi:hypothetical protein